MIRNETLLKAMIALAIVTYTRTANATPRNEMARHSIDGGGVMRSAGGNLELSATIGQPDGAVLSGGGIELTGGFWFRLSPMDCDEDGSVGFVDYTEFLDCVTGPAAPVSEACGCFDVNASDTVDLLDWAVFQREFNDNSPPPGDPGFTTVTGRVQVSGPDGVPVQGATVELIGQDRSTSTGVDGVFAFGDVPTVPPLVDVVATATINDEELFGGARFVKPFRGGTTDVGIITLSNIVRWVSPADGLWSNDVHWEAFFPPEPGQSAVIDVPDAEITVTHDHTVPSDGPLGDLLCNERLRLQFDTLSVGGMFQMNNTLEMACGRIVDSTVNLGPGALINIASAVCSSKLDGVTINGNMDLLSSGRVLDVLNGLTINGQIRLAGGTGSFGNAILFRGPVKFVDGNATISFIANPSASQITQDDSGNLHIESGVTIRGAEGSIGRNGAPLVQDGLIHSDTSGTIQIHGLNWVNNGTLRTSGDGSELWMRGSWTNHGAIEATNAGRLILGEDTWQNLGTLTATDCDVRLDGEFTIADLGTFDFTNSLVAIEGTLDNDVGLILDAGQFNWKLGRGTVLGGTISSADGTTFDLVAGICCGNPTLDGVTLDTEMRMFTHGMGLEIRNGVTVNGSIRMSGGGGSTGVTILVFGPNRTIDGTGRIEFVSSGGNVVFQGGLGGSGDLGVMTIGPGITILGAAGSVGADGFPFSASLINNGTIHSDRPGIITVKGTDWINNGTVRSSGGGVLSTRDSWTNNGILRVGPGPFIDSDLDYAQSSAGTFVSEIRSTAVDGYGKMVVAGMATLDGTLRIEFENTYNPAVGHSFAVIQYGDHVGEFASVEAPGLDPSLQIVLFYQESFLDVIIQQR